MIKELKYKIKRMNHILKEKTISITNTNIKDSRMQEYVDINLNIGETSVGYLRYYQYDGFSCGIARICNFQSLYDNLNYYFHDKVKSEEIHEKIKSIITKKFIKDLIISTKGGHPYNPAFIEMSVTKKHDVCKILHEISDVQTYGKNGQSRNDIGVFLIKWED